MAFDTLFSPITVGSRALRNRIVHTATVTGLGKDRAVTDRLVAYHAARAEGGAAMIVTELLNVHPTSSGAPILVSAHDEGNLAGFARWAEAVEGAGCRLIGQLGHIGRQQLWGLDSVPRSASSQPDALYWNTARPLAPDEIPGIVAGYAETAERLKRAGFSGVELHGAHGYLIAQFLSPACNDRTDGYGGSFAGRTRFMREVAAAVRAACGADFIVGIKLPADERVPGGIDPDEAERIAGAAAALQTFDYLCFSQGAFEGVQIPISHIHNVGFDEVAKYITMVNFQYLPQVLWVRTDFWAKIPADIRKVMLEVGQEAALYEMRVDQEAHQAFRDAIEKRGAEIIDLTPEQMAMWQKASEGVYKSKAVAKYTPPELLARLRKAGVLAK